MGQGMRFGQGMRPGMGFGQGRGMGRGMGMGMPRGMGAGPARQGQMMRQLNLTQAQKDQMKAARGQQQKDGQAVKDRMKTARQKFQETMKADVPDEAAVRASAGALATVQTDQFAMQARAKAQMMKVLTAEQQQQLKALRGRMNQMGARRMPGGQAPMWRQQMMRRMNPMMGPMQPMRPGLGRRWQGWI
jgi:Spy/CpxP family protein refolding chaperone